MSLIIQQWEFLQDVSILLVYIKQHGFITSAGELYRTKEQQEIYVKKGLSKTINSLHRERLAIDLNFFSKELKLIECPKEVGDFWCSLHSNNEWGGNWKTFKDSGHFQRNKI
jgi:peptidoglycan L-alanyl-D-glutamate endopeptidase CwlK